MVQGLQVQQGLSDEKSACALASERNDLTDEQVAREELQLKDHTNMYQHQAEKTVRVKLNLRGAGPSSSSLS